MINQYKVINLSTDAIVPDEDQDEFMECAYSVRIIFNELITKYIVDHPVLQHLPFHEPFSRNTYGSNTFYYLVTIIYLDKYFSKNISKNKYYKIIVDSPAQKRLIKKILFNKSIKAKLVYNNSYLNHYNIIKKSILAPTRSTLFRFIQLIVTRLTITQNHLNSVRKSKNLILIDTFLTPKFPSERKWYGTLLDYLSNKQKSYIYFVPTFTLFTLRDLFRSIPKIRLSDHQKIIKDDFISIKAYWKIIFSIVKVQFHRLPNVNFNNLNVTPLFQEGLSCPNDFLSLIEAYINIEFFSKLQQKGIKVRLTIDWFEGQAIDKSWNLAVKNNYPSAIRLGNRSMVSLPLCLCSIPTELERKKHLTPDTLLLTGQAVKPIVQEFDKKTVTYIAPAFRFEYLNLKSERKKISNIPNGTFNILVTLPISASSSISILRLLSQISPSLEKLNRKISINVRNHPASPLDLNAYSMFFNDIIMISHLPSILECFEENDILITEASATALEAVLLGVPTITIGTNLPGLIDDSIPKSIPNDLVRRANTKRQLIYEIDQLSQLSRLDFNQLKRRAAILKEDYFVTVSKENVQKFVDEFDL